MLDAEVIYLIRSFLPHGHGSIGGSKTGSHRFVRLLDLPQR